MGWPRPALRAGGASEVVPGDREGSGDLPPGGGQPQLEDPEVRLQVLGRSQLLERLHDEIPFQSGDAHAAGGAENEDIQEEIVALHVRVQDIVAREAADVDPSGREIAREPLVSEGRIVVNVDDEGPPLPEIGEVSDVLRLIDAFRGYGLSVASVVLTRFEGQESAVFYQKKLESLGIRVYRHYSIPAYPSNVPLIISEEGFGNPDTDLIMNCKKIEAEGIKTVLTTDEYAGRDGKSQSLADADKAADALVTAGNANQVVVLPKLDKLIGTLDYITKIAGANADTLREDGSLEVELQVITGATSEVGFNKLSAR